MALYSQDLQVLGLRSGSATLDDIRKAYYVKARMCHPDKGGSKADFQALSNSYERLIKISSHMSHAPAASHEDGAYDNEARHDFSDYFNFFHGEHGKHRERDGEDEDLPECDEDEIPGFRRFKTWESKFWESWKSSFPDGAKSKKAFSSQKAANASDMLMAEVLADERKKKKREMQAEVDLQIDLQYIEDLVSNGSRDRLMLTLKQSKNVDVLIDKMLDIGLPGSFPLRFVDVYSMTKSPELLQKFRVWLEKSGQCPQENDYFANCWGNASVWETALSREDVGVVQEICRLFPNRVESILKKVDLHLLVSRLHTQNGPAILDCLLTKGARQAPADQHSRHTHDEKTPLWAAVEHVSKALSVPAAAAANLTVEKSGILIVDVLLEHGAKIMQHECRISALEDTLEAAEMNAWSCGNRLLASSIADVLRKFSAVSCKKRKLH